MFLLAFPVILAALLASGLRVIVWLRVPTRDPLERLWLAGVLGLLTVGTLTTFVGVAGLLSAGPLWGLAALLIAVGGKELIALIRDPEWQAVCGEIAALSALFRGTLYTVAALLLLYALLSIAPNVQWDTLAQHFLVPDLWLKAGSLSELKIVQTSYFPSLLQVMYALGMALGGEQTASLLGWWWSGWVVLGVLVIGRNLWSYEAGIAAMAVMLSQELYSKQLEGGWADSGVALFVLAATYAPLRWRYDKGESWLWAGALAMGGALASSKHNALLPYMLTLAGLAWWWLKSMRTPPDPESSTVRVEFAHLFGYAMLAMIPAMFWYFRAWGLTGSPVYPLTMWGLFPGPEIPVYAESSWANPAYQQSLVATFFHPLILTFGNQPWPEAFQGRLPPQWVIGLPLAWWFVAKSVPVRWWTWLLIATMAVMFKVAPTEVRYMLFAVPWLALLSGLGFALLALREGKGMAILAGVLLLVPFALRQRHLPSEIRWKGPVIVKAQSRAEFIERATNNTQVIAWMNRELPEGAYLFALEDRMYRLDRGWLNYYGASEKFPTTPDAGYAWAYRHGLTHLFLGDGTIYGPTILYNISRVNPDAEGVVRFTQGQVMRNLLGEPIDYDRHWVTWANVRRELEQAGFEVTTNDRGVEEFSIAKDMLLQTEVQRAHVKIIEVMAGIARAGQMRQVYSDGLNMVFEFDYRYIGPYEPKERWGVSRPGNGDNGRAIP